MCGSKLILDLGSHSAKVYAQAEMKVEQVDVLTWELLENEIDFSKLEEQLSGLLAKHVDFREASGQGRVQAIGTEAMRRSPELSEAVSGICGRLGIDYRTISQREEAELLRQALAASGIPSDLDVINVGGGSIQIWLRSGRSPHLLPFGISDLNQRFALLEAPAGRKVRECIKWVAEQLPRSLNQFAYTGGEYTYLRHFSIQMEGGYCKKQNFAKLSEAIAAADLEELEASSPYDSKWMRGAVASNCIVLACLETSGAGSFMPTDLNIAHGFLQQL
ncbi:Ppx/GppA phosphatase family protein [Paenibacillus hexagrammi]|uniref:Ppx/GppA phosphatase N-terminal domain-containing protein n=1 Tax=Paenibacillus hexagrammi TaxID=2908839 RepID=A0ABY3SI58_9BACL|nr:hypothetical protein [Paenibacillus sp. YPD9-1]UJF33409.1 hypothetical protein L0M14_28535 [Paenibacillus sp. YPD9-1]